MDVVLVNRTWKLNILKRTPMRFLILLYKTVLYALVYVLLYVCVILHDITTSFNVNNIQLLTYVEVDMECY